MDINQLIKNLDKEIRREGDAVYREEQLLRLQEIAKVYEGDDRVISSEELLELTKNRKPKEKFYSGFPDLDGKLEGFVTGESIFVTGVTKHGKTSFCLELSVRLKDQNPLWLSLEEKPIDLIEKFLARTSEVPHFFTPRQNEPANLAWVEQKIVEAKAKYDSKIAFIDHIGFISDAERGRDDTEASRLERISRAVHSLAVKWDVLIFLMGHLTKVRQDQNPDIESIKGSSAMAQESDLTMMIWRKTQRVNGKIEKGHETNVSLQANRRGKEGNVEFLYENGRFKEFAWGYAEEKEKEAW